MSTTSTSNRLDAAQRRAQILAAASSLFAERGYDAVSVGDIAQAAGVTRGLVHHYFGGRREVYVGLLEWHGAVREEQLRPPRGRSASARVADSVLRWLDWTQENRTIWLAAIAPGEDSPRLCDALECWTGLNRTATRRRLRGEATREATHELLASTLEHVLGT